MPTNMRSGGRQEGIEIGRYQKKTKEPGKFARSEYLSSRKLQPTWAKKPAINAADRITYNQAQRKTRSAQNALNAVFLQSYVDQQMLTTCKKLAVINKITKKKNQSPRRIIAIQWRTPNSYRQTVMRKSLRIFLPSWRYQKHSKSGNQ